MPHPRGNCRCGIRAVQSLSVLRGFEANQRARIGRPAAVALVEVFGRVARLRTRRRLVLHPARRAPGSAAVSDTRTELARQAVQQRVAAPVRARLLARR